MDKEIILSEDNFILSRTDKKGIITSVNDYFCEVSGYSREELIGKPHNIIRHPDMPKAVFRLMWTYILKNKENIRAVVKNQTKHGDYYWVITDFSFNSIEGDLSIKGKRDKPTQNMIKKIIPIYKKMLEIENQYDNSEEAIEASTNYLLDLINKSGFENYNDFIFNSTKKSFFKNLKLF